MEVLVRQIDEFASTTTSRAVHARDLRTITESVLFLSPGSSDLRIEDKAASIGKWAAAGQLLRTDHCIANASLRSAISDTSRTHEDKGASDLHR